MDSKRQKRRLALICTNLNQLGGANRHFKNIYKYLDRDKFKVTIFFCSTIERELKDIMLKEGVLENDIVFLSRFNKWLVIPFIFELKKAFISKGTDIVHTCDIQSDIFGALAARLAGINDIYALFESRIIPENTPLIMRIFYRTMNMIVKGLFVKTIVVSEGLRREVISGRFRDPDNVRVIHLGFNIPDKYRYKEWPFEKLIQGSPLIGTISRLSEEKGIERFVNVVPAILRSIPDARFTIIGKGPEEARLKMMARQLGVASSIVFKGWTDDVLSEIEEMDLFVMPSIREGCPNALFEALALSRPVVASKIDGISDIIKDGINGLLVDTASPDKFAEKIIYLCKNAQKAILMGKSGQSTVRSEFTIEKEVRELKSLYCGL